MSEIFNNIDRKIWREIKETLQWPPMENQLVVYTRMRSRISLCIRVILKHYTFTLEGGLLGHYPPGKIQKTN